MTGSYKDDLLEAARLIARADRVCALTGAGISVESGIPDFRGAGGLWQRYDPAEYAALDSFLVDPGKVWRMLKEMDDLVVGASPNPGHKAMAELEGLGKLEAIITQNVDNLHQEAGSGDVIEFHGNGSTLTCLDCGRGYARAEIDLTALPPRCRCGGALKPNIIFFGETIPEEALNRSIALAGSCQVMVVVGTSATVVPASMMPLLTKRSGGAVIEINLEPTELTGRAADLSLVGRASMVLPELVDACPCLSLSRSDRSNTTSCDRKSEYSHKYLTSQPTPATIGLIRSLWERNAFFNNILIA